MLRLVIAVSFCLFASFYPLWSWVSRGTMIQQSFYRFNIGLSCIMASLGVFALFGFDFFVSLRILSWSWIGICLICGYLAWSSLQVSPRLASLSAIWGMAIVGTLQMNIFHLSVGDIMVSFLGAFVLAGGIYAMNMGHWYLNVPKLPIAMLVRTVRVLALFLILRLCVDIGKCVLAQVNYRGELLPVHQFMMTLDGVLLFVAVFFGLLFPLLLLYFVLETLRVKSTQSATGILYVLVSSLLIGELTFQYYLIQFGIVL